MDIDFPEPFLPLLKPYRYKMMHGGRAGMKSWSVTTALLVKGLEKKIRVLCTREIQHTIRDSVHYLLKRLIDKYNIKQYDVKRESIVNTVNGSEFIFKGLHSNVQEIKSMERINYCWIEEAQSVSRESLDLIIPTIREEGSEIWATFNRYAENDPIYETFCRNPTPDTVIINTNYWDNPFFTEVLKKEMLKCKAENYDLYLHIWEGQPKNQADMAVLKRSDVSKAMERTIEPIGVIEVGVDVARFGDDRTVMYKRHGLKVLDYRVYKKIPVDKTVAHAIEFINQDKTIAIKVDDTGVGGGVTDMLAAGGYNVIPVNFGGTPNDHHKYDMVASEMWFDFAESIDKMDLIDDSELKAELTGRLWDVNKKGQRCIESKKRYKDRAGKSPDLADALLLCFYTPKKREVNVRFI